MLSKAATMILGLINREPQNPYELLKQLNIMKVRRWYDVADSTVYATLRTMRVRGYVSERIEEQKDRPNKKVYTITPEGRDLLTETIRSSLASFDFDTTIFSIAAFFIDEIDDASEALAERVDLLKRNREEIERQIESRGDSLSPLAKASIERSKLIVEAELQGTRDLLDALPRASSD